MDALLVKRAQRNDMDAFVALMEKHKIGLYKVAKSYLRSEEDVADVMQDTVLSAYEHIQELKNASYFKTWLTRILINHCNQIYRQRSRMISEVLLPEEGAAEENYAAVEWREFLMCLDEKYRVVTILYYVEGFKIREIAEILQINAKTVSGRLATARDRMEKQYTRGDASAVIYQLSEKNLRRKGMLL